MRILLIIAPHYYVHANLLRTELLGVLYLASSLRSRGHYISIFDPTVELPQKVSDGMYYYGITDGEIKEKISNFNPDVIGISCNYAYGCAGAYKIARIAKEVKPDIVTVIGGVFPSTYKEKVLLDCDAIDYALMGESEQSLAELLVEISSKSPTFDKIDGLIYRSGNKIMVNEKKCFINPVDSIPFPARDLVDIKRYMNMKLPWYGLGTRPTLSLLTSRSCPNRCTYCFAKFLFGVGWRPRSPENVLAEIEEIINKYNAEQVFIVDDNFTFDIDRAKVICEGIIRKKYRFCWNAPNGISVKKIDAELAHLMKRAGCINVNIGIESGSEYIRNAVMKKDVSDEEIITAVKHFNTAKIPIGGFIMLGMPGEDKDQFKKTLNFITRLKLSFISISFAIPFPGTDLYNNLIKDGVIREFLPQATYDYNTPMFSTQDFTVLELLWRRNKLFAQFYATHIQSILTQFFTGRLNWISTGMLKRIFIEKVIGSIRYKNEKMFLHKT